MIPKKNMVLFALLSFPGILLATLVRSLGNMLRHETQGGAHRVAMEGFGSVFGFSPFEYYVAGLYVGFIYVMCLPDAFWRKSVHGTSVRYIFVFGGHYFSIGILTILTGDALFIISALALLPSFAFVPRKKRIEGADDLSL